MSDDALHTVFVLLIPALSGMLGGYFSDLVKYQESDQWVQVLVALLFSYVCCLVGYFVPGALYMMNEGDLFAGFGAVVSLPSLVWMCGMAAILAGIIWLPIGLVSGLFFYFGAVEKQAGSRDTS